MAPDHTHKGEASAHKGKASAHKGKASKRNKNNSASRPKPSAASRQATTTNSRFVAWEALQRIDHKGAFANLVLDAELRRSELSDQDRRFATQLVYGTTRMRRACDFLVDRFLLRDVDDDVRSLLRLGAYQLHFLSTPDHAAVDATVSIAPRKVRGFVNAVLRKVSGSDVVWPDDPTRLSYPDWLVARLVDDLGRSNAMAMLERMNVEPRVHERQDGYVQDLASQWVCDAVGAKSGELVADLCAAPGGKATLLAASGATVVGADRRMSRARLVATNARRTGAERVLVAVGDGTQPPWREAAFDRVLVDAPCSGLGVLRRRADARWRIDSEGIDRLTRLQGELLQAAQPLVKPGGRLVYSVCTVTTAETTDQLNHIGADFSPVDIGTEPPAGFEHSPWRALEPHGAMLLPQDHDTDGMAVFAWTRERPRT